MTETWVMTVERLTTGPERRWFHRYILRRRSRTVSIVVLVSPLPNGTKIEHHINAPTSITFPAEEKKS